MKKTLGNKKILFGVLTILLVFAIIVVSSFFPFIFDPSRIFTKEFLTDELIITAIVCSVTIAMLSIAQAGNGQNPNSELCKSKVEFKNSLTRIENHTVFFQWVKRRLQVNDKKEIAEREMGKLLIPYEVYELEEKEILALASVQKINDKFYGPYDIKKLEQVIKLKKYIAKIKFVSPSYYTTVKNIDADKTLSELAKTENIKKMMTIIYHLATKIIITWVFASILGSLVRDLTQEGGSNAQTWMKFLSRAFAFGQSCFLGYNIGCKLNDLDAFYILKRIEAHTLFLEDKVFVYVDESKEEYLKRNNIDVEVNLNG